MMRQPLVNQPSGYQINESTGPKFIEVTSYNMQMVILKGFFPEISLLLLTLKIFYKKVPMC